MTYFLNLRRIGKGKVAATNIGSMLQKMTLNQPFEIRIVLLKLTSHGLYMSTEQIIKTTVKTIIRKKFPATVSEQKIFAALFLSGLADIIFVKGNTSDCRAKLTGSKLIFLFCTMSRTAALTTPTIPIGMKMSSAKIITRQIHVTIRKMKMESKIVTRR